MDTIIIFTAKYFLYISATIAVVFFLRQPRQKQREILVFAVVVFPLSYLIAKTASFFYFDPRPFVAGNFTPLIPHAPDNGFPSDHTLLAAAISAVIFRFNKKLGIFLFFLAFLVGAARVLAGIHHIVDIAGSVFVVLAVYIFADYFSLWLKEKK